MDSIVTGATGGIGRHIALGLARAGHHVLLVARDPARGAATRAWIEAQVAGATIEVRIADLSLLAQAAQLGAAIVAGGRPVGLLVNNAGVFAARRELTAEGHERVIAVNHLAPFVLTRALLPALGPGARVVNVGSSTSDRARIDPDDLEGVRRWGLVHTYAQSKLALLMATRMWAARLAKAGVLVNVVHPGAVASGLVRAGGPIGLAWRAMAPFLLSEAQGAAVPLRVALDDAFAAVSGAYVKGRGVAAPNRLALDPALCARLWAATVALSGRG